MVRPASTLQVESVMAAAAATSAFTSSFHFLRRHTIPGVRSPPATLAWVAGGNPLLRLRPPSDPLLLPSPPFYPSSRWRHTVAISANAYYDDTGEGSPSAGGAGGMRAGEAGRRLYVGNLPYSMTPSQLADVFSEAGAVASVEVVYDRLTDRSRGFAFVTMGSADEAMAAIRMFNGAQLGGRTAKVNFPEVPRGGEREVMGPRIRESRRGFVDSPHKLYAGNLAWTVTSDSLRGAFAGCAGLLGARVVYERDTGRSRGFGFVSFVSSGEALSALDAMDGTEVEGRPLRLNVAASSSGNSVAAAARGGSAEFLDAAREDSAAASFGY
uniref:Ribonucleoprotein, chloroplastic n=1 Tax=Anthurium amnicola TaxID=1678845 RepID=A0A1D1XUE6_9ARAE